MSTHIPLKSEEFPPVSGISGTKPKSRDFRRSRSRDGGRSRSRDSRPTDRRRAKSRSVSPNCRGRSRVNFNYEREERRDSRDVSRGRSHGFHYGKNHLQNRPYFKHVRGRGSQFLNNYHPSRGGPPRRQALLETPVGRYPTSHPRRYNRGSAPFRGSQRRNDSRRDGDFFDAYSSTSPNPRRSQTSLRAGQSQEPFCDTASQSSGSVNYNFSHKRSLEMVRDCSPVSDEDESSPKRSRELDSARLGSARLDSVRLDLARPDSTVCDMDIVESEGEESVTRTGRPTEAELQAELLNDVLLSVENQFRKREISKFSTENRRNSSKNASKVEELIDQAWESEPAPCEVSDISMGETSHFSSAQPHSVLLLSNDGSSAQKSQRFLAFGTRKRSNSCPQPDLHSFPRDREFPDTKSKWLTEISEMSRAEFQGSGVNGECEVEQPVSFADLMSVLPCCQAKNDVDLNDYRPPIFLSKISWLDPLRAMRKVLRKNCGEKNSSDVTAFFDTLHTVEDPDLPYPVGSLAFSSLFKKLHENLDHAIGHAAWFRSTDSPDEQLGVHFLHAIKMCLLEQLRDFPNVSQPDRSVTRLALDMLLEALIHVDGLADCTAQLGITNDLTDIVFSTVVSLPCRKLTCCILEIFLFRVSHYPSVKSFAELLRKNGTVSLLDVKIPMQRVQFLLEFREAVEVTRTTPSRPVTDLSIQDPTLIATIQEAREEANAQILRNLMEKIVSYREISEKGSVKIDCHAVIYVLLKNSNFMSWFLEVLRQISTNKMAENLRKSHLLNLSCKLLNLLLEDDYGPVFLADRSSNLSDIVRILHKISIFSSQEKLTEFLEKIIFSLKIRNLIDLFGSKQAPNSAFAVLTSLLLRTNCSQTFGSFFVSSSCFKNLTRGLQSTGKSFSKIIFSLIFSQYDHPGIFAFVDNNPECREKLDKLDLPLWKSIHRINSEAKNFGSSVLLFQGLCGELEKVTKTKKNSSNFLATTHIVLDTFVFLCANDWFRNILQNENSEIFLKIHRIVVEHFQEVASLSASKTIDCLENLLWESVWVNNLRILSFFIQSSHRRSISRNVSETASGSRRNLEKKFQFDEIFLEIVKDFSVLQIASLPIRPKTRSVIQSEIGRNCIMYAEEVLDADPDQPVTATPFYGLLRNFLDAAVCSEADVATVIAYCSFFNATHPALWTTSSNRENLRHEDRLSRRKNWEIMNKLNENELKKILSIGLCCTVAECDAEFRLWFWRFCEISENCLNVGVASLFYVVCGAASAEIDGEILSIILQKFASFLRISKLRKAAIAFLENDEKNEEKNDDFRPEMFDSVIQLIKNGPVFTEKRRRNFLLPISRIFVCLLEALKSGPEGSTTGFKFEDIAAAIIYRLQKEASVPVIYCLWPVLEQLFQTNQGIFAFLTQSRSQSESGSQPESRCQPVLNWMLLGIANEIRLDSEVFSYTILAKNLVSGFAKSFSTENLRNLANMVVAHTRNSDPYNPSYRVPQNRDPDAILSAHFDDSKKHENVEIFQKIIRKMLVDFSKNDQPNSNFFPEKPIFFPKNEEKNSMFFGKKNNFSKKKFQTDSSIIHTTKERYIGKSIGGVATDEIDESHGLWQEKEIRFHLFVERCIDSVDSRYVVDEEMVLRKELEEWLQRKIGGFGRCGD